MLTFAELRPRSDCRSHSHYDNYHHAPEYHYSQRYVPYSRPPSRAYDSYMPPRRALPSSSSSASYNNRQQRKSDIVVVTRDEDRHNTPVAPVSMGYRKPNIQLEVVTRSELPVIRTLPHEKIAERFYFNELRGKGARWIMCDTIRKFGRFEMNDGQVTIPRDIVDPWKPLLSWIWSQLKFRGGYGHIYVWHFKHGFPACSDKHRMPSAISVYEVSETGYDILSPSRAETAVRRARFLAKDLQNVHPTFV